MKLRHELRMMNAAMHHVAGNEKQAACGTVPTTGGLVTELVLRSSGEWGVATMGCIWCRSTSVCLAHCSPLKRAALAEVMRPGLVGFMSAGGAGSFTTVGLKMNAHRFNLELMCDAMAGRDGIFRNLAKYRRARGAPFALDAWRDAHSVSAWFRAMEVTYNFNKGWNIHFHFLFLRDDPGTDSGTVRLSSVLGDEFVGAENLHTNDAAGWEFVRMWCDAADRWGHHRKLDVDAPRARHALEPIPEPGMVTRKVYRNRYGGLSGPNHATRLDDARVADYLAKVGKWDVVSDISSVSKRTKGDGLSPMGMLLGAIGQQPLSLPSAGTPEQEDRNNEKLADLCMAGGHWQKPEGQKRYQALLAEYLKVFHGKHVLEPSRRTPGGRAGFWDILKVGAEKLAVIEDTALLQEAAKTVLGGEVLERRELHDPIRAEVANSAEGRKRYDDALQELRTTLVDAEGQIDRAVNAAITKFCGVCEKLAS